MSLLCFIISEPVLLKLLTLYRVRNSRQFANRSVECRRVCQPYGGVSASLRAFRWSVSEFASRSVGCQRRQPQMLIKTCLALSNLSANKARIKTKIYKVLINQRQYSLFGPNIQNVNQPETISTLRTKIYKMLINQRQYPRFGQKYAKY